MEIKLFLCQQLRIWVRSEFWFCIGEICYKTYRIGERGGAVVKVLCYKSEGRWFDSRWCHWNFFNDVMLRITLRVPGEFPGGKCDPCVRLTTLPSPCAVVMKSGNLNFLEPSGPLQACNGTDLHLPLPLPTESVLI